MGLAASQGRLLMLTARKSDLEFQAQQICQKRLILAQQLEAISREYEEATSNRQMKIGLYQTGDKASQVFKNLTYAALVSGTVTAGNLGNKMGIQGGEDTSNFASETSLVNNNLYRLMSVDGAIVVSDESEIPVEYDEINTEPQNETITIKDEQVQIGDDSATVDYPEGSLAKAIEKAQSSEIKFEYGTMGSGDDKKQVIKATIDGNTQYFELEKVSDNQYKTTKITDPSGFKKLDIGNQTDNSNVVVNSCNIERSDTKVTVSISKDVKTSNHVTNSLGEPDAFGIYTVNGNRYIVDRNLKGGSTDANGDLTASNYLQDCLRNGKYMLQKGDTDIDDKEFRWHYVSWDGTANIQDSYYTEDDEAAKAKYDRLQSQIQNQDKKLELELENIETQRSAVTTEIESEQKIVDDNAQSSFKIFNA